MSDCGEEFRGVVRDLSAQGRGVVDHPDGRVFFVKGAWPGDEGRFRVKSMKKRYGFADLIDLEARSQDRRQSPCEYQGFEEGKCGGCGWMFVREPAQLKAKENQIRHLLIRAGVTVKEAWFRKIWASESNIGYRNRAQFKTDGERLGFLENESHSIVDIGDCLVLDSDCRTKLKGLRERLPNQKWVSSGKNRWSFIDIDHSTSLSSLTMNKRAAFRQGNENQNKRMKKWVADRLSKRAGTVLELFCGSGNFTEVLNNLNFSEVHAWEVSKTAIEALESQHLKKVFPKKVDLFKAKAYFYENELKEMSTLVLDPPRAGFMALSEWVKRMDRLEKIIYISCDPSTMVRDICRVMKQGFEIVELQPVDLYPQTPHVECLVELVRSH